MPVSPNAQLRMKAREALKRDMPVALLVSLIAILPSLLAQVLQLQLTQQLNQLLADYLLERTTYNALLLQLTDLLRQSRTVYIGLATLLSAVLLPFLSLGRSHYTLKLLRNEETAVVDVLSRAGCFFKAIWLRILTVLYVLLWSLPGLLVTWVPVLMALLGGTEAAFRTYGTASFIGTVLTLALGLRAALKVAMAEVFMADAPDKKATACMRESRNMMAGCLGQYLWLLLPIMALVLPVNWISGMMQQLSTVIGLTVSMACELLISVYMQTAKCAFYEAMTAHPSVEEADAVVDDYIN